MTEWLKDEDGNKCSADYFGSTEEAKKALDSLKNCENCTNCSGCSGCSDVARLIDKKDLKGGHDASEFAGPPPVPQIEGVHARVLAAVSEPGALDMSTWHTCGTTHCRAGWVVHLAGEAGYALERFHDTALAAQLIYRESNREMPVSPTRLYETNAEALADMKRMADLEAGAVAPEVEP